MTKRMLSILLTVCMVFTMMPTTVFATDGNMSVGASGIVCTHHTEHNEDCGFVAAQEATEGTVEVPCDMQCTDTDGDGKIDHAEGCAYTPATEATPTVDGVPCGFVCEECMAEEEATALFKGLPSAKLGTSEPAVKVTYDVGGNTSVYGDTTPKTFSIVSSGFTPVPTSYTAGWYNIQGTTEGDIASAGELSVSTVTGGNATLTLTPNSDAAVGTYYFKVVGNEVGSNIITYTITQPVYGTLDNPATTAEQLAAAFNATLADSASYEGNVVKLLKDFTGDNVLAESIYVAPASDITLDLNGKSITGTVSGSRSNPSICPFTIDDANGDFILSGSGGITGGNAFENGMMEISLPGCGMIGNIKIDTDGIVNITGGNASAEAPSQHSVGYGVQGNVTISGTGAVNIMGGAHKSDYGANGVRGNVIATGSVTVNITGGEGWRDDTYRGKALSGTLTYASTLAAKGGDSAIETPIDSGSTANYRYVTVAPAPAPHAHCVCGGEVNVGDHTEHADSITYTAIGADFAGGSLAGSIYLDRDVTLTSSLEVVSGKTLNLCLNGYKLSANGGAFSVITNYGTLNLCDCNSTNKTYYGKWNEGQTEYEISDTASDGADKIVGGMITGSLGNSRGGGIYNGNTANLYSGTIAGNNATSGGGVYTTLASKNVTTNLYAIKIIRNIAKNGGGIYITKTSAVLMYGGEVKNNTASRNGGGMYISHASSGYNAAFTLAGGEISGNKAGNLGGGIYAATNPSSTSNVTLNLQGGIIQNNTSSDSGGGVYVGVDGDGTGGKTAANLSGNVTIKNNKEVEADNNLYLASGKTINITVALTNTDKIGVNTYNRPADGKPVAITSSNDSTDYSGYFTSDNASYEVYNDSGTVMMRVVPPVVVSTKITKTLDLSSISSDVKCTDSDVASKIKGHTQHTHGDNKPCWAWDNTKKILTLNNVDIEVSNSNDMGIGIALPTGEVTITFAGNNSVKGDTGESSYSGINSNKGSITITGNSPKDTLTATGQRFGVTAMNGTVTITEGIVNATGNSDSGDGYGIGGRLGVNISGGTVTATSAITNSSGAAIWTNNTYSIKLSGGKVTAQAGVGTKAFMVEPTLLNGMVHKEDTSAWSNTAGNACTYFAKPEIISGKDQTFTQGSGNDMTLKSNINLADFERVEIGKQGTTPTTLAPDNYTTASGSTIVTLKNSYLKTLAAGTYNINIVSTTGTATTTFTIKSSGGGNGSSTGGGYSYDYYDIKIAKEGNGTISPDGGSDRTLSVREWRDQTFTFTPDKGYAVSDVLVDGKSIGAKASYTFKDITKDHTLQVIFKAIKTHVNPQTGVAFENVAGSAK